jgi:hypothetical protein
MIISPIDKKQETQDVQNILNSEYQNIITKRAKANYEIIGNSDYAKNTTSIDITKIDWNNLTFEDFCAVERRLHMNGQYLKSQKPPTLSNLSSKKENVKVDKSDKKIQINGFIYNISSIYYEKYKTITDNNEKIKYLEQFSKGKTEVFEL